MQIHSIGIDLGKTTLHLVALGGAGKVLLKKKFTQRQLLAYTAIMARRKDLHIKAEYICADLSSRPNFPLAVARRTIHCRKRSQESPQSQAVSKTTYEALTRSDTHTEDIQSRTLAQPQRTHPIHRILNL
jgi:hypothetical protein